MPSCSVANIEITLTNVLEFTHSGEHWFFEKVTLRSYILKLEAAVWGVCERERERERDRERDREL